RRLIAILAHEGRNEELLKLFEQYPISVAWRASDRVEMLLARAAALRDLGKLPEAENGFREALALSTKELSTKAHETAQSQKLLIELLKRVGKSSEAENLASQPTATSVTFGTNRARESVAAENWDEAAAAYVESVDSAQDGPQVNTPRKLI